MKPTEIEKDSLSTIREISEISLIRDSKSCPAMTFAFRLPISTGLFYIRMRIARIPDKGSKGHSWRAPLHRDETNSGLPNGQECAAAQRNPLLLLWFDGLLLFRFDARKLSGLLLFQEPPRRTRCLSLGPTEHGITKKSRAQSVSIRMPRVTLPRRDTRTNSIQSKPAFAEEALHFSQATGKPVSAVSPKSSMFWKDHITHKIKTECCRRYLLLYEMKSDAQFLAEEAAYLSSSLVQNLFRITQQNKIVSITQIAMKTQSFANEMIHSVEIDITKELACLVANGQPSPPLRGREEIVTGKPVILRKM